MKPDRGDRVYAWLLFVLPADFRREFGVDMVQLFGDRRRQCRERGESLARLWLRALGDLATQASAERWAVLRGWRRDDHPRIRTERRWRVSMFAMNLRQGFRSLVRNPGLTVVAGLTLALGISANTAIFSVVDAVLLRPLPFAEPDRLVMIWEKRAREGTNTNQVALGDFLDWRQRSRTIENMVVGFPATFDLTGSGEPENVGTGLVSAPFFDMLGVSPALGRTFRADEDRPGRDRVVMLTYGFWQRRFGGNPSIVGRRLTLGGDACEVVGVLPASFRFVVPDLEIWRPTIVSADRPNARTIHFANVFGRLKPGVSREQAQAEMDAIAAGIEQEHPESNRGHGAWITPLHEQWVGDVRNGLLVLTVAVGFVLLIACANVANLLLARAAGRQREVAIRGALGADRRRLLAQLMTEALLLALVSGLAGLLLTPWTIMLLQLVLPASLSALGVSQIRIDARVLSFTLLASLATSLVFGFLPAWQTSRLSPNDLLKGGGRSSKGGVRSRTRGLLVVSEVALAFMLLIGAGLMIRSFAHLLDERTGLDPTNVLTFRVELPTFKYKEPARHVEFFNEINEHVRHLPGVTSVGATADLPFGDSDIRRGILVEGRTPVPGEPTRAHPRFVTPGYLATLRIALRSGRAFTAADVDGTPPVVIVNETAAKRYWPGQNPVGRRVSLNGDRPVWREIVGVIADVRHWGLGRPVNPELYFPAAQMPMASMTLVVRSAGNPADLSAAIRAQVRAMDADLPLAESRSMEDVIALSVGSERANMLMLGALAGLALLLACAGIYGVMAHLVALRASEIGVRMTLGARPADVLRMVLGEGLRQTAGGIVLGIAGALSLTQLVASLLYHTSPVDPAIFGMVTLVLLATSVLACLVPAYRATRVDPIAALRSE
jgi:predicted permease